MVLNPSTDSILIVDDNPTNLSVLKLALNATNFSVRMAANGEKAIEQVYRNAPALILLDVDMPVMDGFEACRRLKSDPVTSHIPIIFMTALADTKNKVKGLSLGAVDYITKPFEQEEILARVKVQLHIRQLTLNLQHINETLERQVAERTASLQNTQLQLVQSEKMATLGNLVAGVAHEINNPIGFLKGSVNNAEDYVKDLLNYVQCLQENDPQLAPKVRDYAQEIDLEFLTEDLPKLISSMKGALRRIEDISTSLRTFSRADTSQKVACDLHEGIDSTLLILKYRLKANDKRPAIEVIKEYAKLPPVKCFLGQLNQVFMNIIANAIDALDAASVERTFAEIKAEPQKIIISTKVSTEGSMVIIRIKNNGPAIPESIKARIFDHLFTTKGVGKGTGLGLAIARQIVEETHSGRLSCHSIFGEGTEFVIEIPCCN
ncbi:MAG: response regulator [Stigonema ocellatum SAG 48.90 = DSM 106950]|nr:response regulator [Stigonema ocellatum SAG 48.90 = DSM 106950]